MNISELSIRRPVLATVLTIIILLFGLIGYTTLGVREYPSVDNPIISVTCSYPGANAEVIENQITEPLEQNINGIPGIRSLSSTSQQGQCRITVEFELSVDLETAANDVRDKVSRAQRYLPRDCDPPTVSKADADASPILMVAIQSNTRSLLELSEIADLTVKEQLQTIPDVSSVSIWGEKRYSMRLWLDPVKMAGYGITPVDVKNAINDQNLELPSGSIEGNTMELTLRTMGQMHTAKEFNERLDFNGVVLTKLDGDTRGGAALSIRSVVNKPIKFVGTGEKLDAIDQFHPARMADRILGMGDIVSLVERAQEQYDEEEAKRLQKKIAKTQYDFNDFLSQIAQIKKMGNLKDLASMIPGVGKAIKDIDIDDNAFKSIEAIIYSMTPAERSNPEILNGSRRTRIAKGSGTTIQEVNRLLKQFDQTRKMMKMVTSSKMGKMMPKMKR